MRGLQDMKMRVVLMTDQVNEGFAAGRSTAKACGPPNERGS
jgi:hypothetical protein